MDAVLQHAAGLCHAVEDRDAVSGFAQVIGGRQAAGACASHGDLFAGFAERCGIKLVRVREYIVAYRPLHCVDVDAVAVVALVALVLAGMRADARGDHRQRVALHHGPGRPLPVAGAQLFHVARDVGRGRAGFCAGRAVDVHAAEDGVVAVLALDGVAEVAALALAMDGASDRVRIAVVPAAYVLTDVAANGGEAADQRRGDGMGRFGQSRAAVQLRHILQFRAGADHV